MLQYILTRKFEQDKVRDDNKSYGALNYFTYQHRFSGHRHVHDAQGYKNIQQTVVSRKVYRHGDNLRYPLHKLLQGNYTHKT